MSNQSLKVRCKASDLSSGSDSASAHASVASGSKSDHARVRLLGQRAKRFITAGGMIDLTDVESVPLVVRGQLVTLESIAGGIQVVTSAKATKDGLLGETITVRASDNKRVEFDAVVVGVGRVRVGGAPFKLSHLNLAEAGS